MSVKLVTIGVYGFSEETFFEALRAAEVEVFCDIRYRRGVRGSTYAFANSRRLQKRLAEMGIQYLHLKELAPAPELRQLQYEVDKAAGVAKRQRELLSRPFAAAYRETILANFEPESWLEQVGGDDRVVALCCVERAPAACHRSIVARKLEESLGLSVRHILP